MIRIPLGFAFALAGAGLAASGILDHPRLIVMAVLIAITIVGWRAVSRSRRRRCPPTNRPETRYTTTDR
ncbi:hypothetical protein BHE97_00535 [Aeromicrobium sp. PE09-221]|uniref:hypothetical protein n=1 Tax=Aeromicrobium sp. PE09-221 TaxID=1898043 RepID=UPI000B3E81F9|nr:hypothetical protein [Aeromicrobium sp. PE09-221]OUZ12733.1 hypothetical protein BHE97_00535 [Aeromicrobium sp. PE09-221]